MQDITIIIKTFNRKKKLIDLIKSIRYYYPQIKTIILDDGKASSHLNINEYDLGNTKYITEEYDIGLSRGRNILLNEVNTKYFILCDDDFLFDKRTDLELAKKLLEKNKADIVGGIVYNKYKLDSLYTVLWAIKKPKRFIEIIKGKEYPSIYNGHYEINNNNIKLIADRDINHYNKKNIYKTDICSNFFIAKTSSIKKIGGWTPDYVKVGEHELFFLKTKQNNLKIFFTSSFGVMHLPTKSIRYLSSRNRAENYFKKACDDLKYNKFIIYDARNRKIIYEYRKK